MRELPGPINVHSRMGLDPTAQCFVIGNGFSCLNTNSFSHLPRLGLLIPAYRCLLISVIIQLRLGAGGFLVRGFRLITPPQ